jgi:hypothetical protein
MAAASYQHARAATALTQTFRVLARSPKAAVGCRSCLPSSRRAGLFGPRRGDHRLPRTGLALSASPIIRKLPRR